MEDIARHGISALIKLLAAPMCDKNRRYAQQVAHALAEGRSPGDFPPENYETGRRTLDLA
ncbi:hypothetical protein [Candidatus Pantoea persica]|uniref:hypothetical protein n=1 Tax=Candidatus Pantoea persica TaxID=2518128 RepID=UPI0035A82A58